ncbi:helix-turn-helix domain-containing protein [Malacoplasma iowae]|uniref:helix-turn-helix domain-containing protein n=1 Tax=Malacoplasma iowae TaxID=2116 RepID=UPI003873A4D6|nr:helix-turn-helix domain-containing protein [Malacoplasma iowae]WPL36923.1 helix-turn-helix domain-containing protein [Malacoplasma iowae]WPL37074.1 helix-turn-helix domain-containing protein [Malacoplasma iowae]
MKTYKHLTKEERCLIYFLWNKEKYSMNKIAKILNKNKSTISRELKRNTSSNRDLLFIICSQKIH